jgi:carbohydrate-binding DOMON domain-containing protein
MKIGVTWMLVVAILVGMVGAGAPQSYFEMKAPPGDGSGTGAYQYPTNVAFQPFHGLFDITGFKVWSRGGGLIYFDTSFAKITNPWLAPEGFIHQNLRIFINSLPNRGLTELPKPGANVRFNPRYPWDIGLKIVGWGNSQLILVKENGIHYQPLKAAVVDENTIRTEVPERLIGTPQPSWNYYVFVGSYDGFGADFYRRIEAKPGEWVFGGNDQPLAPRVLDLLAPASGPHSKANQLGSFDPARGRMAELYPVGLNMNKMGSLHRLGRYIGLLGIGVVLILILLFFLQGGRIRWFWVAQKNGPAGDDPTGK